ncbi:MAG: ABC transporter substrate-binding protein [Chloroflexi bacterium]|nr:ABC transporter substrate-binding protein [Chloroflexota bacterium]
MKMPRVMLLVGAATAILAFATAACGSGDNGGSASPGPFTDDPTPIQGLATVAEFPTDIPRSDGKTLTLAGPPTRIVSLSPAATEIIYALGAEAALAAVDNQADFPDGAMSFSTKVDAYEPNIEAIAGLDPDLVIVANNGSGIVEKLDQLNIPVFYQDIDKDVRSISDVFGQITLMGRVTGRSAQATQLLTGLGDRLKVIQDGVQGANASTGPRVYHELDQTFFTISDESFIGDLYRTLRARNIAGSGGGSAYPQMTQEAVIASNPAIIILADEEFGVTVESVKARPGWSAIEAVQNDRIFGIDPDIVSRPGPRIIDALEQLAKLIYPTRFR